MRGLRSSSKLQGKSLVQSMVEIVEWAKVNGQKLARSTVKLLKRAGQNFDLQSQL